MKTLTFDVSIDFGTATVDIEISDKDYATLERISRSEDVDTYDFFSPDGDGAGIYNRIYQKALPLILEQAEEFGHLPLDYEEGTPIDEVFDIYIEFPENFD